MHPEITVLMAVYNGERFLHEAIDSILHQTFHDFEFIIINDGSTDNTHAILSSYQDPRIRIAVNEWNIGLTRSLNKGLALARGQYIARIDADDVAYPERLEKQLLFMQKYPEVAVLGTQTDYIDSHGRPLKVFTSPRPVSSLATKYALMFEPPVSHPTVMYRKDIILDKLGGYDPTYAVSQDTDLWIRAGKEHVIRNLPDTLVAARIVPGSVSYSPDHPRRDGHLELWIKRRHEVMKDVLGGNAIPREWGEWWELVRRSRGFIGEDAAAELLKCLDIMQRLFLEKYPSAQGNEEIDMLTADCKARVALHVVEHSRLASIPAFLQAAQESKMIALQYAPKYLGLLVFGQSARQFYNLFNHFFR